MRLKARKIYRIGAGILFPLIYGLTPSKIPVQMLIIYLLGIMTPIEVIRKVAPGFYKTLHDHSKGILKEEPGYLMGTTAFLLATLIIIAVFSKGVAILSLLFLIFGDTSSTIVGTRWGRVRFLKGKSLEGSLAFLITCLIIGFLFFRILNIPIIVMLIGAITATVVEAITVKFDDNFTVGLGTAITMELLIRYWV